MTRRDRGLSAPRKRARLGLVVGAIAAVVLAGIPAAASAQLPSTTDPRVGLSPGLDNAGRRRERRLAPGPSGQAGGLLRPRRPGQLRLSELRPRAAAATTRSSAASAGSTSTTSPTRARRHVVSGVVCPGGQGDLSALRRPAVHVGRGTRRAIDCGTRPRPSARAFQGVRIFDISDTRPSPVQVAAVQTCRGSHTHSLVTDPDDASTIYVYVSGTAGVRSTTHTNRPANCVETPADRRRTRAAGRIDVIKVPLAAPAGRPRSSASRGSSRTPPPARSTACRTPRRRRSTRRGSRGARRRSRTPATTSRRSRRSGWPRARARATAS